MHIWGVRKGAIFIHNIYIIHYFSSPKWMNIRSANKDGKKSKGLEARSWKSF